VLADVIVSSWEADMAENDLESDLVERFIAAAKLALEAIQ
jgi:hypothetical protein